MSDQPAIVPKAAQDGGTPLLRVGDLLIDLGRQRVTRGEGVIGLPKLSYELLMALARAAPNLVSIDALMEQVWPKAVVSPETLNQRIKLLRDALGDDPRNPRYVEGLRGRGYRLIPPVERVATAADEAQSLGVATDANASAAANAGNTGDAEVPGVVSVPLPQLGPRRFLIGTGIIAVVLISGLFVIRKMTHTVPIKPKTSVEVVAVQPRAVAVLPFENLSSAPENDYIALGMADSVLHELASIPELIVVARSSSFALGKPAPDAREAGRRLGVRYLVEGSVQRAGKALRVTAQLIDTTTNNQLWSLKVDRTIDDVFLLQDQIAQRVAQELDVTLHGRSANYAHYGTDAYLAFLKGRALIESRRVKDVEEAIRQFSRAIELAPAFAAAIAELARAKYQLAALQSDPETGTKKLWPEINALVDQAIEIDPSAGEPYFLRAQYKLDNDAAGAEADFRKGIDLAPNYGPGLRLYASYLLDRDRFDEALTVIDRARLVDPLAAENHYLKGEVMRLGLRRPEEAAELYLQALAVVPDFYPAYTRLAQVRFIQGSLAEAIKYGEKSIAIEPSVNWTRMRVIWLYVDIGDLSAARDVLRGHGSTDMTAEEAVICYRAGNLERAESLLRKNIGDPDFDTDSLAFDVATDAVVERAIAMHAPDAARQFILSIPGVEKERGTLAVTEDNFSAVAQLATLEHFAGNQSTGDDLARRILEFFDHGGHSVAPARADELERAWALALLGRADAALSQLESFIRSGNHAGWWVRLERNPAFTALRATPRFQAIEAETRIWLQNQVQLLEQMRLKGEVPRRQAATSTANGC